MKVGLKSVSDPDTQALVGTQRLIAPTKTLLLTAVRIYLKEYGRKVGPRKSKSAFEQIPRTRHSVDWEAVGLPQRSDCAVANRVR